MRKEILSIISAALILGSALSVSAGREIPNERQLPRLVDDADTLDAGEERKLEAELDRVSEKHQCDVAVATVLGTGDWNVVEYADDFYDYYGYGMGEGDDGILLLVDMEARRYAVSTHGFGIEAFTDAGLDYIEEEFLSYLKDDLYYDAFQVFAEKCDIFLEQAETGKPFDVKNMPKEPFSLLWIPISIVIGMVMALIVTGIMRAQMKTVRRRTAASEYTKPGSMRLTVSRDLFLYSRVDRTAKPKDSGSGSGGSGGSSVHTSSSGRSHGGSSGSF